jgi:hypothetical protein
MGLAVGVLLLLTLPLDRMPAIPALSALAGMRMPWLVLIAGGVANTIGSWFILAAAAQLQGLLRWLVVALFAAFWATVVPMDGLIIAPVLAALAYVAWTQFRPVSTGLSLLAAFVPAASAYALSLRLGDLWLAFTLLNQLTIFYLLFIPVIFLSGFDLGETAVYVTRLGLRSLYNRVPTETLWWVALILAGCSGLWAARGFHSWQAALTDWLPAFVVIALGALLTRRVRPEEAEPPELLPFVFSMVVMATVGGLRDWHAVASWVALASIVAGATLLAVPKGRRYRETILFLILFGLFNSVSRMVYGPPGLLWIVWHQFPSVGLNGLTMAVLIAIVGNLLWIRLVRQITPARVLLALFAAVALLLVAGVWSLLAGLQSWAGDTLAGETLLLIVGLAHDVWASGGMLNRGSRHAPRSGRILLYVGYIVLLCGAAVLANGTAGPTRSLIRIDTLQQAGLFVIGIPLFLEQFLYWFTEDGKLIRTETTPDTAAAGVTDRG